MNIFPGNTTEKRNGGPLEQQSLLKGHPPKIYEMKMK